MDEKVEHGWDTIPERLQDHARWLKHIKDSDVEGAPFDDNGDIPPQLTFFRDGEVVAWGHADAVDRDRGLQMAAIGISALGADKIWFTVDAHMTDQRFQERYGRLPDPNELQQLCDNEGACQIGLTTDCLWSIELLKDGTHMAFSLPYHVDRSLEPLDFPDQGKAKKAIRKDPRIGKIDGRYVRATKKTHWMDESIVVIASDGQVGLSGRVMDCLTDYFKNATLRDKATEFGLDPADFGLDERRAQLHLDIVAIKFLTGAGFVTALAVKDEADLAVVKESMAGSTMFKAAAVSGDDVEYVEPKPIEEADLSTLMSDMQFMDLRRRLRKEAAEVKEADRVEAERRRAQRVDGQPSDEDRGRVVKDRDYV